jgi:hypothetical protein
MFVVHGVLMRASYAQEGTNRQRLWEGITPGRLPTRFRSPYSVEATYSDREFTAEHSLKSNSFRRYTSIQSHQRCPHGQVNVDGIILNELRLGSPN